MTNDIIRLKQKMVKLVDLEPGDTFTEQFDGDVAFIVTNENKAVSLCTGRVYTGAELEKEVFQVHEFKLRRRKVS